MGLLQTLIPLDPSTAHLHRARVLTKTGKSSRLSVMIRAASITGRGHSSLLTRRWRVATLCLPLLDIRPRPLIHETVLTVQSRRSRPLLLLKDTLSPHDTRRSPLRLCRPARPSSKSIHRCTLLRLMPSSSISSKPNHSIIRVLPTRNLHHHRPFLLCHGILIPGLWSDRWHRTLVVFWMSTVKPGSSSSFKTCQSGPKVSLHFSGSIWVLVVIIERPSNADIDVCDT